ncbi:TonB-dependent receptor [Pseudahrensia aquimaris]|uniref:TonB-dependent receptor n=1 Tax=Pseudahrensia aquimaris TaxID=744461 RepID=A0ABW3FK15_9HYPH
MTLKQLTIIALSTTALMVPSKLVWAQDSDGGTTKLTVGENTEKGAGSANPGAAGFSISYDGETVAGAEAPVDFQREADIDLSAADVQVKFDGLGVEPTLNVATSDLRHSYQSGDEIEFRLSTNYPAWISQAEVRIFEAESGSSVPVAVLPAENPNGFVSWVMPSDDAKLYEYVYRVYDAEGRFDETQPLGLRRTSQAFDTHETGPQEEAVAAGEGDDRTATRSIPVYGGAVTVFGRSVPEGARVTTIGGDVPIDADGNFVVQRILPPGDHVIDVAISGDGDQQLSFERELTIPENEWFYVGLADLTVGRRLKTDNLVADSSGEFDKTYTKGRLAFYLKGKIKGRYLLTAAADTGEERIEDLLKNLDAKDPRAVLRRIDPDKFYPVYGDDSTAVEDAPTEGKFYVRLQKDDSHVMWGTYRTTIKNTEFVRNDRTLYGAHARYKSPRVTVSGDAKVEAEAYVSQPSTLPQRDNLLGTGGSVYFLSRSDINRASETLVIETRDAVTDVVVRRRVLRYREDYDINYTQGVVILKQPLASTAPSSTLVRSGALGGDRQYLVAQYEFTPALGEIDGYSYGGRAQGWVSDRLRVGVSGLSEKTGEADQQVIAADILVKLGENSHLRGEIAGSRGPGFSQSNSINGGLTINSSSISGDADRTNYAYRADLHIDLSDFDPDYKGFITAYYQKRDKGFSSPNHDVAEDERAFGVRAKVELTDTLRARIELEDFEDRAGKSKREADAEVEFDIDDYWTIGLGIKHTHLGSAIANDQNGDRTDIGARLTYNIDDDQSYFLYGQGTVHRSGNLRRNNRIGVGLERQLTEKLGVLAEVSYGNTGVGGLAQLNYSPTPDDTYYIGYRLDPDREYSGTKSLRGVDRGGIVIGARRKYSDELSAFMENNYDMFGQERSLTSTYGVTYTPSALWTFNGGVEIGQLDNSLASDLDRTAISASVSYKEKDLISWRMKGEVRFEDSQDDGLDRTTYLASAGISVKQSDDWRFLGNIDAAISDSNQADYLDGDFIEASIGYAYRPADNDKLNALFKYSYLYDFPGPDQVNRQGEDLGPAQRSHVLTADVIYDVNEKLSVGAKYGFRIGEVSQDRSETGFVKSSAHLGVVRGDYHIVKKWDVFAEARILHTPEIDTTYTGFVVGAYRHFGENLKVGAGYNFGQFSDDVTDLTLDDEGVFLNVIGKF